MSATAMSGSKGSQVPVGSSQRKVWEKLSDKEKIERMRGIIKNLQQTISYYDERLYKIQNALSEHEHTDKGVRITKTLNDHLYGNGLGGSLDNSSSDSLFF